MAARLAIAWIEDTYRSCATALQRDPDDVDDWLAGRDDLIEQRHTEAALATVHAIGGEVA